MRVGEGGDGNEELSEVREGDPKSREFRVALRMRVGEGGRESRGNMQVKGMREGGNHPGMVREG